MTDDIKFELPLEDAELIQNALERAAGFIDADDMAWSIRNGLSEVRPCSLALELRAAQERIKGHVGDAIVEHYHAQREEDVGPAPIPVVGSDEDLREIADLRFGRNAPMLGAIADPVIKRPKRVAEDAEVVE